MSLCCRGIISLNRDGKESPFFHQILCFCNFPIQCHQQHFQFEKALRQHRGPGSYTGLLIYRSVIDGLHVRRVDQQVNIRKRMHHMLNCVCMQTQYYLPATNFSHFAYYSVKVHKLSWPWNRNSIAHVVWTAQKWLPWFSLGINKIFQWAIITKVISKRGRKNQIVEWNSTTVEWMRSCLYCPSWHICFVQRA